MPLISIEFALFFTAFLALYWSAARRPRVQNLMLLAASAAWLCSVSAWFAASAAVFTAGVSCFAALVSRSEGGARRFWLGAGLGAAAGYLAFCKYYDFFRPALQECLGGEAADILMPLGISYYTFQGVACLVSVFKKEHRRLGFFNLFLFFSSFLTVTSGPIARTAPFRTIEGTVPGMAGQLLAREPRKILRPAFALTLIALGVLKKWWLAGLLASKAVDPVFENPFQCDAASIAAGLYGYTAELFLDFSGYSDLVIGAGLLLGFRLPMNFMQPLRAANLRDFWARWHITLSAWIRDYVYIPLGGSRGGFLRTQANLVASMVLSGIWHGYGLTFGLWGLMHGLGLVALNLYDRAIGMTREKRKALAKARPWGTFWGRLLTVHFVVAAFVVFRANSLSDVALILEALASPECLAIPPSRIALIALALMAGAWLGYPLIDRAVRGFTALLERLPAVLWPVPLAAALLFAYYLAPSGVPGFLYANF